MTDAWPDGWTRQEGNRVARSRQPAPAGAEYPYDQDPYGRGTQPADPYADPYSGDQLRGMDTYGGDVPPGRRVRKRRWPKILAALVVVMLVVVVGGYFYLDSRLNRESVLTDYAGRPADTPGTNWLVVGSDSREGLSKQQKKDFATGNAAGRRTDSMMLLHYGDGGTTLVSLPRDSYLPIPGRGSNKLNAAFAFGGPKLLVRTVEQATDIRIDHYAEIGFGGFVGVVDAIGGVDICVKSRMKDPKAGIDLQPGCQTLTGGEALGFVRTRASARADLDRIDRQRQFFGALMKKATSPGVFLNPFRGVPLAMNATSNFIVDDNDHLIDLTRMMWAMRGVSGGDGVTTSVPLGASGSSRAAGSYLTWHPTRSKQLFSALKEDQPVPKDVITK
ncbi:LCP family protein [Actinomadura rudentiformis]|nr:LCP family protein [Actinomadura rudentiformis]